MANAEALRQVKSIIEADPSRKYVVVSAPGKRTKTDTKITDALYACYDEIERTGSCDEGFKFIYDRFTGIVSDLSLNMDIETILKDTKARMETEKSADFCASRGEYLSAMVMAEFLGAKFVDAESIVRFDSTGRLNEEYTDDKVKTKLRGVDFAVIPGFYGKDSFGKVKTFSRGGSDITGSIIARGVNADLYENWTDVSGFLVCDPRIVPDVYSVSPSWRVLLRISLGGQACRRF